MENSSGNSSKNSLVENLSLVFDNLRMRTSSVNNNDNGNSPLRNNSLASSPEGSLTRTQQVKIAPVPSFENPMSSPIPLYSNNIWTPRSLSNAGGTMSPNTSFGAPSRVYAASESQGVRDCMLNNNLDLNLYGGGIESPNYSSIVYGFHNDTKNFDGFSNQQNLNIDDKIFLMLLQDDKFIMLARDPTCSQHFQRMLLLKDPEVTQKILEGTLNSIFELMTDEFGHYVFGKLIDSCNITQLQQIVTLLCQASKFFIDVTNDKYGSNSIKKLIRVVMKSHLIFEVLITLSEGFFDIMITKEGFNVVSKCLDLLDTQKNEILYEAAKNHCLQLATHENGCISLNCFINNMKGHYRNEILDLISDHSVYLSQDPSGNYVVQHVLGFYNPTFTEKICYNLKGHYIRLSLQKGGSHVIEKCLKSAGVNYVIEDLLSSHQLVQIAKDQYGNYVIQTALNVTKETNSPFHQNLLMKLMPHLDSLRYRNGRNVVNLIKSLNSFKNV